MSGTYELRAQVLLKEVLAPKRLRCAVLSQPETVAWLTGYCYPFEDWPVADPFISVPALAVVSPDGVRAVIPDCHGRQALDCVPVVTYKSYVYESAPDPWSSLKAVLSLPEERVGVEALNLPLALGDHLRAHGHDVVFIDEDVVTVRAWKQATDLDAIVRASELADVIQRSIKENAVVGVTEAELAGQALAAMYREAGQRVPAILALASGPDTAKGSLEATGRRIFSGDLVLTDTSPWINGVWSDSANTIVVGTPDREHLRVFDAVRRALDLGISLCRPGAISGEIDRRVREELEPWGPTYRHHTGHGLGAANNEEPRIIPDNTARIEEGMVLAVEPGVYIPGWGGIRLEDAFLVGPDGNELLTKFEHSL